MAMITQIEEYFTKGCGRCARFDTPECSALKWAEGQQKLRQICREAGLEETVKWGHPCYMHAGRNIAVMGAFRDNFRLTFFNAALMTDPKGVLQRQGANTQHADMLRFDSNRGPEEMSATIAAYLREAMSYAQAGIKAPKVVREVEIPEELIEALDADAELAEAFQALTPGRQKSYAFNLNSAKRPEARIARIARFRDKIIAGKGALER